MSSGTKQSRSTSSVNRAGLAGGIVVALGVCAVLPIDPAAPARTAVVAVLLAALIVAAAVLRSPAALRTAAFVGPLFGCFAVGILADWPPALTTVLVCALPLACLLLVGRWAGVAPAAPWLARGRLTPEAPWLGLATVLFGGVALVAWALAVRPEPAEYLRDLQRLPLWLAILGIVGFALVNPVWEEMLFRGVLLSELATVWGARAAVLLQAVLFGAAHHAGFPSGTVGMVMAGTWGLALGVLRLRSGGILVPYLVHVTANAVIGTVAVLILR
ncbi:CPBP family intramembrane glutamic endopeptidase [Plantactinospora sp. BB1]|uniref:CPBP family intramembrane glutamic endopeptidase n=1 Tax=Plantactinospora sp. BB1 TaxID=2071627 RepID=UPI001F46A24A|nr:type II CAAX endopeptidase family protein [Plantactinospora sp. BB1]